MSVDFGGCELTAAGYHRRLELSTLLNWDIKDEPS